MREEQFAKSTIDKVTDIAGRIEELTAQAAEREARVADGLRNTLQTQGPISPLTPDTHLMLPATDHIHLPAPLEGHAILRPTRTRIHTAATTTKAMATTDRMKRATASTISMKGDE